ncbi:MAG: phage tail sheath family protein [Janthinobacterium lividum]
MPEYLAPGLFVEEIDSGSKPIEGVGTNTAAFIGYAKSGPFNKPTFISDWTSFCRLFGEEENAYTDALCQELGMTVSEVRKAKDASRKGWVEYAGIALKSAVAEKKTTIKWQEFLRKYNVPQSSLPYIDGTYLAHAVKGYYNNGGGRAYIVRVAHPDDMKALAGTGSSTNGTATKAIKSDPITSQITAGPLLLTAQKPGTAGNDIKVEVEHVGDGNEFRLKISQSDGPTETFPDKPTGKALTLESVSEQINKFSKLVKLEIAKDVAVATAARPEAKVFVLAGGLEASVATDTQLAKASGTTSLAPLGSPLSNGLSSLRPDDFVGDSAQRTGLGGLSAIDGVNMISIPDLMAGLWKRDRITVGDKEEFTEETLVLDDKRRDEILAAQSALVQHCEMAGYRMAIVDPLPGLSPQEMNDVTMGVNWGCEHGQAAIYYPWIKIADPVNKGQQIFVPPSGHMAGVWARVGGERGVHKAPANEAVMGAVGMEVQITKGEQEILNPNGINCIRSFPGTGIRVWGARTLATRGNPSWKYVNVRRLFNYLEESMDQNLQWVVFEPNDQDLWGRVRRNISAFLYTSWKEGMLMGAVPQEAYYVKCDSETNPQEMIDLGRMYVEIGINPVKPAEFVIVRIGQWSGGSSASEA